MEKARDIFDLLDDYRRVEIQILALGILQKTQVFNSTDEFFFFSSFEFFEYDALFSSKEMNCECL